MKDSGAKPSSQCEVWRWSVKVNFKNPSDEYYSWLLTMYEYGKNFKTVLVDKRTKIIVDTLWHTYRYFYWFYMLYWVVLFGVTYSQGWVIMKPDWIDPVALKTLVWITLGMTIG